MPNSSHPTGTPPNQSGKYTSVGSGGGSSVGGLGQDYPSPFFDLASQYLPDHIKELFEYSRYYFYAEPVVHATIRKMAQYPITDIIINSEDSDAEEKWEEVYDKLGIKSFLVEIGLDYFAYGNSFVTPYFPFIRKLECPECEKEYEAKEDEIAPKFDIEDVEDFDFREAEFEGKCPECDEKVVFDVQDKPKRDAEDINLKRWNPINIEIEYNDITGEKKFFYDIPNQERTKIRKGEPHYIEGIPKEFLEAVGDSKKVELKDNMIYHLHRETLAQKGMGWGRPLTYPVMKYLFYLQTLRKAQETVAVERSVPFRFLYPEASNMGNPANNINLSKWQSRVNDQVQEWRQDPANIPVFPFPIAEGNLGGDAKALLLTPEINNTVQQIVAGMGVPQEFVYGGLQYTGSSISLRMMENKMLNYRKHIEKVLKFINDKLKTFLDLPDAEIKMQEFKMADDVQQKKITMQLNQSKKISDKAMLEEFGYDFKEQQEQMIREIAEKEDLYRKQAMSKAKMKGMMSKIVGEYQIENQEKMMKEQQKLKKEMAQSGQVAKQQAAAKGQGAQEAKQNMQQAQQQQAQMGQKQQQALQETEEQVMQAVANNKGLAQSIGQQINGQLDKMVGNGDAQVKQRIMQAMQNYDGVEPNAE